MESERPVRKEAKLSLVLLRFRVAGACPRYQQVLPFLGMCDKISKYGYICPEHFKRLCIYQKKEEESWC